MDSEKYSALLTAVNMGSLSASAEKLGYSQAGLTHMMNRLESEAGLKILRRDKSGVHLTSEGEKLLPYIKEFISSAEKLEKAIRLTADESVHTIKIVSYASIINQKLPHLMSLFKMKHPNVKFEVKEEIPEEIYKLVSQGKADMGFVSQRNSLSVNFNHLMNDELLAVLPIGIFGEEVPKSVAPEVFGKYPVLVPTMGFDMDMYRYFSDNNVTPNITNTSVNDAGVVSMVECGLGVSILSELILTDTKKNVLILPLTPSSSRNLGIITKDDCTSLVKEFCSLCVENI